MLMRMNFFKKDETFFKENRKFVVGKVEEIKNMLSNK